MPAPFHLMDVIERGDRALTVSSAQLEPRKTRGERRDTRTNLARAAGVPEIERPKKNTARASLAIPWEEGNTEEARHPVREAVNIRIQSSTSIVDSGHDRGVRGQGSESRASYAIISLRVCEEFHENASP